MGIFPEKMPRSHRKKIHRFSHITIEAFLWEKYHKVKYPGDVCPTVAEVRQGSSGCRLCPAVLGGSPC